MLLRDELEDLRMIAQKVQARIDKEDVVGRVVIKPDVLLKLIEAYEKLLEAQDKLECQQPFEHEVDEFGEPTGQKNTYEPFRW